MYTQPKADVCYSGKMYGEEPEMGHLNLINND
jgi:hypothetical protein